MNKRQAIERAYFAGLVTKFGKLIVYGECAERGTYAQFANVEMNKINFNLSREALATLAPYTNEDMKSRGLYSKSKFYLTRTTEEIIPLMVNIGLSDEYAKAWKTVLEHDIKEGIHGRWRDGNHSRLEGWETKTLKVEVPFVIHDVTIMATVLPSLLANVQDCANIEDLLLNAFIEGGCGLSLGSDDFETLENGASIMSRYKKVA